MKSFLSPVFIIGQIRIGTVEGASAINFGNNRMSHFRSDKKHIQGFGTVAGDDNNIEGAKTALHDADVIDMLNTSEPMPEWVKQLVNKK